MHYQSIAKMHASVVHTYMCGCNPIYCSTAAIALLGMHVIANNLNLVDLVPVLIASLHLWKDKAIESGATPTFY